VAPLSPEEEVSPCLLQNSALLLFKASLVCVSLASATLEGLGSKLPKAQQQEAMTCTFLSGA